MALQTSRCSIRKLVVLLYGGALVGILMLLGKQLGFQGDADVLFWRRNDVNSDDLQRLEAVFLQRLSEMKINRWNVKNTTCEPNDNSKSPCFDSSCKASFAPANQRLRNILQWSQQQPIEEQHLSVIRHMADSVTKTTDITFVLGASQNHFHEVEGMLKDLFEKVLPFLKKNTSYTYQVVYYDLGLSADQLDILDKHCECTVIKFPFQSLPPVFSLLPSCSWKTAIIKAHYGRSRFVVWLDACVRFREGNISSILQTADRWGLFISRNYDMMPAHVAKPTLDYFHMSACVLAPFYEVAGGFLVFKRDELTEKAVLDPWLACAFSPNCLCPGEQCMRLRGPCHRQNGSRYSLCHRYDQAAIGVILTSLYDYRATQMVGSRSPFSFKQGDKVDFFPRN